MYMQMRTPLLMISLFLALSAVVLAEDASMTVKPALNEPPSPVKAGARPYEMEGRRDIRVPLVDFQDLTGWTITCEDGANADFVRTN